eukprot:TRINITY_DN8625_c0_g1_i3.p1 TRINITY_DN8625_c0_g1~~TRINITY_DN8625_c0_g1_i3.p1  ORF type:complete len:299 (-),score=68.00 TRINITY_DN8625_c0_g1_i3:83-979(-)
MKYTLLLFALVHCFDSDDLIVTREYVDYLKKHVDWTVEDYENNIFRGWTFSELNDFLGHVEEDELFDESPMIDIPSHFPSTISWAHSDCVHEVKDQGKCGACWAFVIANMLSDRCCLEKSDKGWLSVQELISCDSGSFACYGGGLHTPIKYIKSAGGLVQENCFPYQERNVTCLDKCTDGSDWKKAHVCNCSESKTCYQIQGIKSCLASGPTPVGFSVCQSFMSYKSGIYACDCGEGKDKDYIGNHATMAVGYSESPTCHLYMKNSWGTGWGDNGYFNMTCETCKMSGGTVCTKFGSK